MELLYRSLLSNGPYSQMKKLQATKLQATKEEEAGTYT